MAHITKQYYDSLKESELLQNGDWKKIAVLSQKAGMQKGNGYTRQWIQQVVVDGVDTADELVELIRNFYESRHKAHLDQLEMAKTIKMRNAFA